MSFGSKKMSVKQSPETNLSIRPVNASYGGRGVRLVSSDVESNRYAQSIKRSVEDIQRALLGRLDDGVISDIVRASNQPSVSIYRSGEFPKDNSGSGSKF